MVGVLPPTSITPHSWQEDNSLGNESRFCFEDRDETFKALAFGQRLEDEAQLACGRLK